MDTTAYLNRCKREIEQQFFAKAVDNGSKLSQRDFEFLIDLIEERSHIKLSLSTLKRIWRDDYSSMPQRTTLDGLVSVLGFGDWYAFTAHHQASVKIREKEAPKKRKTIVFLAIMAMISLACVSFLLLYPSKEVAAISLPENITFTADKTVVHGVPNTVIFNYDLKEAVADSFSIQRSWNPKTRTLIDKKDAYLTVVYYYPGFHWANLMANDSIIAKQRVHVTTNGWLATAKYNRLENPIYLNKDTLAIEGKLQVSETNFKDSGFDRTKDMVLSFYNVNAFENINSAHFEIETRIKMRPSKTTCPSAEIAIIDEKNISWLPITQKGCEGTLTVKMGDTFVSGEKKTYPH